MTDPNNILEVNQLSLAYDTSYGSLVALDDVSFEIKKGECLGLAGESGSGKSTVARAILGLLGPEATIKKGSLMYAGADLRELSPEEQRSIRGNKISIVFQDPFTALNPSLTIGAQVAEPLIFHKGMSKSEALEKAVDLLASVGINRPREIIKAYPHQLSGGMQQRVLIATALSCDPDILILDEPTTALDVTIEAQILDLLDELCRTRQLGVLFVSHNLAVINRLCERVCILYAGRVLEYGKSSEVFSQPRHPYTKGLIASLASLGSEATNNRLTPIPGGLPDMTALPANCVFQPRCPFKESKCASEIQHLATMDDGRTVRCWKAQKEANLRWTDLPSDHGDVPQKQKASFQPSEKGFIEASNLTKTFSSEGILSELVAKLSKLHVFRDLQRSPHVKAVDGISLAIAPGEVIGLVGESGCGKSTLARCMVRLIETTSGEIFAEGKEISREPERKLKHFRQSAQIIFQNPDSSLNPRKTVGQIIKRPMVLFGLSHNAELDRRVSELLEMVRLPPAYAERYPHQLSGGEKQRVGIARALATSPKFIVCDEAISALDVSVQAAIINLLQDLKEKLNLSYLFISHDLSVVAHLSNRIAVMYRGIICEEGVVEEVLRPPFHPYTEALLSAVPRFDDKTAETTRIRLKGDVLAMAETSRGCRFHPRCPRKIGKICEEITPPVVESASGHRIACHLLTDEK
ncbi:ABC transporter ATP-binding protein [Ruegeria sp. HKCCD8929]|uniref:dipeptide ABC transporter ATP-binding protein n=1 Tax=Ruegeria sp. HKCCD8929 TaxID=2683006 RepID=UPI00148776CE|nr:ABC transporter ATP-binding protein [Ruegeria sp. HKCCD8929]